MFVGADDPNEGTGPGECVEHVVVLTEVLVVNDRLARAAVCARCGAPAVTD